LADKDNVDALTSLPEHVRDLFESVASLPHLDPTAATAPPLPDPSKRPWETSKTGYINWAVGQLVAKTKEQEHALRAGPVRSTIVENTLEQTEAVGEAKDVKNAAEAVQNKALADSGEEEDDDVVMDTS
jgi:kinetochore protein Mis12/MTW1